MASSTAHTHDGPYPRQCDYGMAVFIWLISHIRTATIKLPYKVNTIIQTRTLIQKYNYRTLYTWIKIIRFWFSWKWKFYMTNSPVELGETRQSTDSTSPPPSVGLLSHSTKEACARSEACNARPIPVQRVNTTDCEAFSKQTVASENNALYLMYREYMYSWPSEWEKRMHIYGSDLRELSMKLSVGLARDYVTNGQTTLCTDESGLRNCGGKMWFIPTEAGFFWSIMRGWVSACTIIVTCTHDHSLYTHM